jgi:exonuclease VII small subunit
MVVIVVLHLGGVFALRVGQFAPVIGAYIGGILAFGSACLPRKNYEKTEAWIDLEQLSWILIGFGMLMWGMGDSFWRYYVSIGQSPFPSVADAGYSVFPLFAFIGLLLLPRPGTHTKRLVLLMDSLIAMGSLLALSWYFLLGSLAQAPGEANLGKFLGLYYPTADTALISCIIFLLLRGRGRVYQSTARRVSLLLIGLGLCFFVTSDFLFNVQNNAGTYIEATWVDLGWPLGMLTIGLAAYTRRFLPATPEHIIQERMEQGLKEQYFGPSQLVPYVLLVLLFLALSLNVLTNTPSQQALRPVLLFATLSVVVLVIARQVFTIWENKRLTQEQTEALQDLERANRRIEEQAHQLNDYNVELERGIEHLKDVQAHIANGHLKARANLTHGALLPLAASLNLMAERLARLGQNNAYATHLTQGLAELSYAFERHMRGEPFVLPESCVDLIEVNRLLVAMRMRNVVSPFSLPPSSPKTAQPGQLREQAPRQSSLPVPHPVTQPMQQPTYTRQTQQANTRLPDTRPLTPRNSIRSYPVAPTADASQEREVSLSDVFGARQRAQSSPFRVTIHTTGEE